MDIIELVENAMHHSTLATSTIIALANAIRAIDEELSFPDSDYYGQELNTCRDTIEKFLQNIAS